MSINPLFTGPTPMERSPMYNSATLSSHSASGMLRQTNLNSGNMSCNGSPGPRKKPRMSDSVGSDLDPFDDFDSFTEDDLETFDMIASQALSQAPDHGTSVQTLKRPAGVLSHSAPVRNNSATTNITNTSTGYAPLQPTSKVSSSGRFSFKSTGTRAGHCQTGTSSGFQNRALASASSHPQTKTNTRQSNVAGNKIYLNYSPHYHSGTSFHGGSQQFHNSDSTKAQTLRPDRPAIFPPKKPVQSCIGNKASSKSESSLGTVDLPNKNTTKNTSHGLHVDTSHHTTHVPYNTKPTFNQHGSNSVGTFHLPTSQGGGCSTTTLTPPHPASARESPNLPTAASFSHLKPSSVPTAQQQQFPKYRSECETLKQQLKSLTEGKIMKDGEIEVLRQNLNKAKAETSRLQMERVQAEELRKQQIGELERDFKRENESLKTQLQFKEAELMQAHSATQNYRTRMPIASTTNSAPTTPPKHPSSLSASRPDEATRNSESNFPTQQSFMADNPKVERGQLRSPRVRTVSEGQAACSTPKRSPKQSPKKNLSSKSPGKASPARPISAPSTSLSLTAQYGKPPRNKNKSCIWSGSLHKASSAEAQLVGSLLQDHDSQDNPSVSAGGLMSLIQGTSPDRFSVDVMESTTPGKRTRISPRSNPTSECPSKTANRSITLVTKAISNILNPPRIPLLSPEESPSTKSTPGPPPNHPNSGQTPHSESLDSETHITALLPLLEDQLTSYISAIQNIVLNSAPSLCSSSCPSSGSGGIRTTDSSESSSSSCLADDATTLSHAEAAVFTSMNVLRRMVAYSAAARSSVLNGSSSRDLEPSDTDGDVSAMEIDPSASLIDPTQVPPKSSTHTSNPQQTLPKPPDTIAHNQHNNNHILSKLMRIASMQHGWANCSVVVECALDLLCVLIQKSCCEQIERLQSLLVHDALYNTMSQDGSYSQACRAIDILTAVTPSWKLVSTFCNQSDSCLLVRCYQCGVHGLTGCSVTQKIQLTIKVMSLLWRIIATHHQGATMLLDTECQCSMELLTAVVLMFRKILKVMFSMMAHQHPTMYWRYVLQQGLVLLHCLAMHDRTFTDHRLDVEKSYIAAVTSLSKLYRRLPDATDNETGLVQDLWDLTQCEDTDEDEDDDNEQLGVAKMEVD